MAIYLSIYLFVCLCVLQKVARAPSVFKILTWKCASRHNSVQFLDIRTSKSSARQL